jgi:hypothetical protein
VRNFKNKCQIVLSAALVLAGMQQQAQAQNHPNLNKVQPFTCGSGATVQVVNVPNRNNPPPTLTPFAFGNGNNWVDPNPGSILSIATPCTDNSTAGGCVIYAMPPAFVHSPFQKLNFFYLQKDSCAEENTTLVFWFQQPNGKTFLVTKNLENDFGPNNETQDQVPNGWTYAFADASFFGPTVGAGNCTLLAMSFYMTSSSYEPLTMKFGNPVIYSRNQLNAPANFQGGNPGCAGENPSNFH